MTTKLHEISERVWRDCSPWERDALIRMGRAVIAELKLRCDDHYMHDEGRIVDEHNADEAWGHTYSADDALEFLQSLDREDKPEEAKEG